MLFRSIPDSLIPDSLQSDSGSSIDEQSAPPQSKTPKADKQNRSTQIPNDFEPRDSHRRLAGEHGASLDDEVKKFRDHFKANGKRMKDWDAALNNWIRRSGEFRQGKPKQSASTGFNERVYTSHTPAWAEEDCDE